MVTVDKTLAVLTRADSKFGQTFLSQLAARGVQPAVLGVEYTPLNKRWKMAKFLAGKIGWKDAARYNVRFWKAPLARTLTFGKAYAYPSFEGTAEKLVTAENINHTDIVRALQDPNITKIVLAQSGIIRKSILKLGKCVLNCHPGKLPEFRGVDVVRWELLQRQPLGVTLHVVDAGIDTGYVLEEKIVPVQAGDTPESIAARSIDISMEMLLDSAIAPIESFQPRPQSPGEGKQYYLMPFAVAQKLEAEWPDILDFYLQSGSS